MKYIITFSIVFMALCFGQTLSFAAQTLNLGPEIRANRDFIAWAKADRMSPTDAGEHLGEFIETNKKEWIAQQVSFLSSVNGREIEYFTDINTLVTYFEQIEFGKGNFSSVKLAYVHFSDRIPDRFIAYKQITRREEFDYGALFSHPNNCKSIAVGSTGKMLMELMTTSLEDYVFKNNFMNKLTYKNKIDIALAIACGLKGIHDHSVVHQDLHPRNILLKTLNHRVAGARPTAIKIADLGCAQKIGEQSQGLSLDSYVISPDQYRILVEGKALVPSFFNDVWALGLIFHFINFGHYLVDEVGFYEKNKDKNDYQHYVNKLRLFFAQFAPRNEFELIIRALVNVDNYKSINLNEIISRLEEAEKNAEHQGLEEAADKTPTMAANNFNQFTQGYLAGGRLANNQRGEMDSNTAEAFSRRYYYGSN